MGTNDPPVYNFIKLAFEFHSVQRTEQLPEGEAQNNCQVVSSLKIHRFSSEAEKLYISKIAAGLSQLLVLFQCV